MRNADVAHIASASRTPDRLTHRLLSANALEHRVSANTASQFHNASNTPITSLRHDVRRAKLTGDLLPRFMTTHCDDPLCTHLLCGEHSQETDRPVTDYHHGGALLYIRRIGREPARAHDIGDRLEARNQVCRRDVRGGHEGPFRERYP